MLLTTWAFPAIAQNTVGLSPIGQMINQGAEEFFAETESGMLSPAARVSFYGTATGDLCAVVAARRGPGAITKSYFSFRRAITTDRGTTTNNLKIKFGKGINSLKAPFSIWEQCLPNQRGDGSADRDVLEITIRRPGQEPTTFSVSNPEVGYLAQTDIRQDAYGHVSSRRSVEKISIDLE